MRNYLRLLSCLFLPLSVLLVVACSPQQAPMATVSATTAAEDTPFVGSAACEPCHTAEFKSHQNTRHAATLRSATLAELGALAPAPGVIPDVGKLTVNQGKLFVDDGLLQLVLGSGKTGMTFLALFDSSSTEIRQSYFPQEKCWMTTPGQEKQMPGESGHIFAAEETRICLSCHVVTLPSSSLTPERRFFGVGCESCHGSGAEHVARMQLGKRSASLAISSLKNTSGEELNALCGRCHRTLEDASGMSPALKQGTNRFQPYGLALSRCFKESKSKLTCVTCHNPHEDAKTDQKHYEKACLSCHSAPKKVCPVNSKEKCVSCHMPTKPVFPTGDVPIRMADHFIKISR